MADGLQNAELAAPLGTESSNYDCEAVTPTPGEKRSLTQWAGLKRKCGCKEIEETKVRKLEDCPNGYPRTSAFLSSETNFSLYRGFDYLHSRILLDLQDQLSVLETELDQRDKVDAENDRQPLLQSRLTDIRASKREPDVRSRRDVMAEIQKLILEYDEVLLKAKGIASFQRPSNRNYRSVRTWFYNLNPLVEREQNFIKCKEDILTLRHGREWASFDGLVEASLGKLDCRLIRWLFRTRELRHKTDDKNVSYYSPSRVQAFVGLIITTIVFILLVLPVVTMYRLTDVRQPQNTFNAIGVLITFTLLFSAAVSLLTNAQRHELFAASAAYCAVLVVFVTNFGSANMACGQVKGKRVQEGSFGPILF